MKRTFSSIGLVVVAGAFSAAACEDSSSSGPPAGVDGGAFDASAPATDGPVVVTCDPPTSGPTEHQGDVKGDEVWTAAGSPHILRYNVNVRDGAKLTIEPCAEVQLAEGVHLHVAYPLTPNTGTLVAEGRADKPITFKALDPAKPWGSVYVHAPGTARFAHTTFENGGGGGFEHGATLAVFGDGTMPADPTLFVDNVTIRKSRGTGAWLQRGATFIAGSKDLTVTASGGLEGAPYPVEIEEHALDSLPTGTYTGNAVDEILLYRAGTGVAGSGLVVDATMHNRGVPYHVGRVAGDDFVVGGGEEGTLATLTIEPGVVMKFEPGAAFAIQHFTTTKPATGAVRAVGTPDEPIVFTSAAAQPKAGDWIGLRFGGVPRATNALDHVRIEYAGFDCSCGLVTCSRNVEQFEGAVIFTQQPPSAFITNSVFKDIAGHGVVEGYDGDLVNFRPSNTFTNVSSCVQTHPRNVDTSCPDPRPICDGL